MYGAAGPGEKERLSSANSICAMHNERRMGEEERSNDFGSETIIARLIEVGQSVARAEEEEEGKRHWIKEVTRPTTNRPFDDCPTARRVVRA